MASLFGDEEEVEKFDDAEAEADAAAPPEPVELSPKSNPDLLGHEAVEAALLADFNAGRMPHALILSGPSGIGKATLAYRIARFLFKQGGGQEAGLFGEPEKPSTLHVSAEDPVFRRVVSGGHADLVVVERELDEKKGKLKQDIPVDSVRDIKHKLHSKAAEGGWRVAIVDSAEYLNATGQNALLKVLEEPPSKTLLILTTSQPGSFLPTIRSRCRMVNMDPLPPATLAKLLEKFIPTIGDGEKDAISRYAEGSIGQALQFYADGGMALYGELLKTVSTIPALDIVALHNNAEKLSREEQKYETCRAILTGWCQRLAQVEARGTRVTDMMPGDGVILQKLLDQFPPRHFLLTWEKMSQMFRQAEWSNLDKRQALIGAFLMMQNPSHPALAV
ncbi:MAG: DNA polymerase III subunit delta' [bacterium]|nr:DNA polymerase III subunit delta' [bacterium]